MPQTRIAAFLNQKGGVGKTTSVVNTGAALAILGKRVLIVDLDPQGHLTTFLGIDADERADAPTVYEVLRGLADPHEALVEQPLGARLTINGRESGVSMTVLPANLDFAAAESALSRLPEPEFRLRDALARVSSRFDYILIDCPPSLGLVATNALVAAHQVFVPVQTEYLALESLENLMKVIESIMDTANPDLEVGGIIATRFDGRKVINRQVVETLRERYGVLLLETPIRENIVLAESPGEGKDIFTYRPRSYGATDYLNLAMEVMGKVPAAESQVTVERGVIRRHEESRVAS